MHFNPQHVEIEITHQGNCRSNENAPNFKLRKRHHFWCSQKKFRSFLFRDGFNAKPYKGKCVKIWGVQDAPLAPSGSAGPVRSTQRCIIFRGRWFSEHWCTWRPPPWRGAALPSPPRFSYDLSHFSLNSQLRSTFSAIKHARWALKGQLISKGLFGVIVWTKKTNNFF